MSPGSSIFQLDSVTSNEILSSPGLKENQFLERKEWLDPWASCKTTQSQKGLLKGTVFIFRVGERSTSCAVDLASQPFEAAQKAVKKAGGGGDKRKKRISYY